LCQRQITPPSAFSEQGIGRAAADAMAMKTVESTIVPRA
jgi:hypothetical protein